MASLLGSQSLLCYCKFKEQIGSLLICRHEIICKIAVEIGNLEYEAKNNTRSLSSRYPRAVRAAPQLSRQPWVCSNNFVQQSRTPLISTHHDGWLCSCRMVRYRISDPELNTLLLHWYSGIGWLESWVYSSIMGMYFLVFWAICIAVDQFLWSWMLLRCRSLRTIIWGLDSYNTHPLSTPRNIRVVPEPSLQSQLHICKFVGLFGSLLFNNCDNGFWVAAE